MYRIVIIGWKAEKYIDRCLSSLISQELKDWTTCVVLDPSDDRTVEIANSYAKKDSRIKVISNTAQMYALPNIIKSINEQTPRDDDVIVTLDADDWFAGPNTLSILDSYYKRKPEILVTHGSWVQYPNPSIPGNNAPYSAAEWEKGIRKVDWHASHLRTFKYKVWKHVRDEDLRDPGGLYFQVAWDLAIMFPVMEIAGQGRVQFIPEKIYVYNRETPYNDCKMRLTEQTRVANYIRAKTPYSYLKDL